MSAQEPERFILRIQELSKSFGALRALDDVDIQVQEGRIHGIIGPNGSGKTTLFNCITGHAKADRGEIWLGDTLLTGRAPHAIARLGVRRTFQGGTIIPDLTVMENVMAGINDRPGRAAVDAFLRLPFVPSVAERKIRERAREALRLVGLEVWEDRPGKDLVWKERQLVQIARAVAPDPRLLLLDEPASGMGERETDALCAAIRKIREGGVTVVVVSHDTRMLLSLAETVTVLDLGRKIAEGGPEQVRTDPRVVEAYLGAD